jgi:O-antigen/teichoic acid export membrane protein
LKERALGWLRRLLSQPQQALLVIGVSRIIHELREDDIHRTTRKYFGVGIGILCVGVGILIIANPTTLGLMLLVFILSLTLIIVGISMIVRGIKGEGSIRKIF